MADFDLKSITPAASVGADTEIVFGATDQSAGTPKPYLFSAIKAWIQGWLLQSASAPLHPGYVAGRYYMPFGWTIGNSGAVSAANRITFQAFMTPQKITISEFFARISAGSAGNFQCAIYAADASTLKPTGTPVATGSASGSTTTSSTDVNITLSSNYQLLPGTLYWMAVNVDNATATFVTTALNNGGPQFMAGCFLIGDTTMSNVISGAGTGFASYFTAQTFGSWPDVTAAGFTVQANNNNPLIGYKVASVP